MLSTTIGRAYDQAHTGRRCTAIYFSQTRTEPADAQPAHAACIHLPITQNHMLQMSTFKCTAAPHLHLADTNATAR